MNQILIARQAILDRDNNNVGYEILYRDSESSPTNATEQSIEIILNSFLNFGFDRLVGSALAYINISDDILLNNELISMFKAQTVLVINNRPRPRKEILEAIKNLKSKNYTIAIDSVGFSELNDDLLSQADFLKINTEIFPMKSSYHEIIKSFKGKIIAYNINTIESYTKSIKLPYDYFQGLFYSIPILAKKNAIPENSLVVLKVFEDLHDPNFNFDNLEKTLAQDAGLSYKLLRYINSATFTHRKEIESIKDALVLIGADQIKKWVTLILLTRLAEGKPTDILLSSLIRAKMSEIVSEKSNLESSKMFTIGLLSLIDTLMDMPMIEVLDETTLSSELKLSLLTYEGEYGKILKYIQYYEQANWGELLKVNINTELYVKAYIDAVEWTNTATEALLE